MTKRFIVYGHTTVTVSTVVEVEIDDDEEIDKDEIFDLAQREFGGIKAYAGNCGIDKIIGVDGDYESIEADEDVEFDDFCEEN